MKILLLLFICMLFSFAKDNKSFEKIDFWKNQKKGTNYFNLEAKEQWFKDAKNLNVKWVRLAYDKYKSKNRDFLIKDADNYTSLDKNDLKKLKKVLSWASKYDLKVVINPLSLPGSRWVQNNNGKKDLKLWSDKKYWKKAAKFWSDLAKELKDNKAVIAYNIINEPIPEYNTSLKEEASVIEYKKWYKKYKNTSHDLVLFYNYIIKNIRKVDKQTPIFVDAGWYAQARAFTYWRKLQDDKVLYSFHMYEPYSYTNRLNFKNKKYSYPGNILYDKKITFWNKQRLEKYLQPYFIWAKTNNINKNFLVASEFGCYRKNKNCNIYLQDLIDIFNKKDIHWAFYSFREDEWDGYDYELSNKALGWKYWQNKEKGLKTVLPRKDNFLFDVIKKEFK